MKFTKLYYKLGSDRAINSFKTAVGCMIGLWLVLLFGFPVGQWVVVSVVVVMSSQSTFGSALKNSVMRIVGTLTGAIAAALILLVFQNHWSIEQVFFFLLMIVFVYIGGSSKSIGDAGLLGGVTLAVILTAANPTYSYILERTGEIVLGVLIALFVTKFVFPIHARVRLRKQISEALKVITDVYEIKIIKRDLTYTLSEEDEAEEALMVSLSSQATLIGDATVEFSRNRFNKTRFKEILRTERRIYRTINTLYHITHASKTCQTRLYEIESFVRLNESIKQMLVKATALIVKVENRSEVKFPLELLGEFEKSVVEISDEQGSYKESLFSYMTCIKYLAYQVEALLVLCKDSHFK